MTFSKRLVLGTVAVLVVTLALLVAVAERSLRRDLEADLARELERSARLVREAMPADTARWQPLVTRIGADGDERITLIDRLGRVLADSDVPADSVRFLPGHAGRPEVRAALAGEQGTASRVSATVGRRLLYVAIPGGPGVVRVAADLDPVERITARARGAMLGAALVALLVGTLLALVAGRSVARPLTQLAGAARAIATGALPRFPRSGVPEVDALVLALRQMHQELAERFDDLRHEQAESAALVESMVEGVIAADRRGHIVTANSAARRLLGYAADEPLPDLAELFRAKAARELVDQVMRGLGIRDRQLELDGRVLLANARPLPAGGAVLVLHDVTELRRLEAVRRDFVANVSHELKTPLTSISGYAETLLGDQPEPATTRRFMEVILANARRMQRLVDDLLDLSRIESGRWQPRRAAVNADAAVQDAWLPLADRAAARGVAFETEVEPGAETLSADPDAVRQILTNLFDNALRYTGDGGRIRCRVRRDRQGIAMAVEDNGSGITREHLPRIFERFYRADPSRSREEGGTGLGLSIVKHLVEAHGGRVAAASALGEGTTVTCWFPAEP